MLPKAPCVFSAPISHHPPDSWSWISQVIKWSFQFLEKPRPCQKPNHPCISRSPGGRTRVDMTPWYSMVCFSNPTRPLGCHPLAHLSHPEIRAESKGFFLGPSLSNEDQQTSQMMHWKGLCVVLVHISKYTTVIFLALANARWNMVVLYICPWDTPQQLLHEWHQNCNVAQLRRPWPWCWGQLNGHLGKDSSWSWHGRSWPSTDAKERSKEGSAHHYWISGYISHKSKAPPCK